MAEKAANRSKLTGAAETGRNSIGERVKTAMAKTRSHATQRKNILNVMLAGLAHCAGSVHASFGDCAISQNPLYGMLSSGQGRGLLPFRPRVP